MPRTAPGARVDGAVAVRRFRDGDSPLLWALNALPNIGATADPTVPLPPAPEPPAGFPDLADVCGCFLATNQPEAMTFYRSLGYREIGRERQPGWSWTLVYYLKTL